MRLCKATIAGLPGIPYSQSALHDTPFLERETNEDYDIRTWAEHCTVNDKGQVCIPAMALKQCLDTAAYKLGMKVPGRKGATYKNFFASGFFCQNDVPLTNGDGKALTKKNAQMIAIWANSKGVRGTGSRVRRRFPQFQSWQAVAEFVILDDLITPEVFETHITTAGMIVGIGRFRPENGGTNGRFKLESITWGNMPL